MAVDRLNQVFVDSSMFKVLLDEKDEFHQTASDIWQRLKKEEATLVTSNYILDEAFTLIRARLGVTAVSTFRDTIAVSSRIIKVMRATVDDEAKAWLWFVKDWSNLSFTDCVSFAMMKRLGLSRVATFDRHFARAGMKVEAQLISG